MPTYRKSLQQQVNSLRRQVARNTNSPYFYRVLTTFNSGGATTWKTDQFNLTDSFVTSTTYHDNITGDKFINNNLHLLVDLKQDTTKCRMIVYIPKNPDVNYNPGAGQSGFMSHPDPNSFWVLKDVYINHDDDVHDTSRQFSINLRGQHSIYNTDNNIIEKGNVKVFMIYYNVASSSSLPAVSIGHRLSVTDK